MVGLFFFFFYKHTETLKQVIQGGNRLSIAPGIWSSARWGPVQTHFTSVGSPVLSRILADTAFRCLFQSACFCFSDFIRDQQVWVLRRWYLFWQCFQYSLSIKVVLKKKVSFSWKGQKFDPNDLASCVPYSTVKAINAQHQEFLFRCLLQIIVPKACFQDWNLACCVNCFLTIRNRIDVPGVERKIMGLSHLVEQ